MSTINSIFSKLKENNIKISLNVSDNLEIKSQGSKIPDEIVSLIKENKALIVDYLKTISKQDFSVETIPNCQHSESYPLSLSQKRLWIISQSTEVSASYNMFSHVFLDGNYDLILFKKAVSNVVKNYEILRTVFKKDNSGQVKQFVKDFVGIEETYFLHDVSQDQDPENKLYQLIAKENYIPYNLENGPLFKTILYKLNDGLYCFYFNLHHIISDGWSMNVLFNNVQKIYYELLKNENFELIPPKIQYKDFSVWQNANFTPKKIQEYKKYWLSELSGDLSVIDLPSSKTRPVYKTQNGNSLSAVLDSEIVAKMKSFADSNSSSLFVGLLTSLFAIFKRFTVTNDLIIGTALSGRDHLDLQNQIGFFINTIAIRNEVFNQDSYEVIFQKVKNKLIEGIKHQSYPMDMILNDLNVNQQASRNPIFDVMFTFQNISNYSTDEENGIKTTEIKDEGECMVKFDLDITMVESNNQIELMIKYNTDVYEKETIIAFINYYRILIEKSLENTSLPIDFIDILTGNDKNMILNEFNNSSFLIDKLSNVLQEFSYQVEVNPDNIAVVYNDRKISYKELDLTSDSLAAVLQKEYKIDKNCFVGIQLERNEFFIISMLAIIKTGAAYVPIDPELPDNNKIHIINDTDLKLLITESNFMFDLTNIECNLFVIDIEFNSEDNNELTQPVQINSEDFLYVIYTSGTTGKAKGVPINHKNVINLIKYQSNYFDINKYDQILLFSNFSFDASVEQIYLALLNGATLNLISKQDIINIDSFSAILVNRKITHLHAVPSFLRELPFIPNTSLKRIISGGDTFDQHIYSTWNNKGIRIINEYGPTETTVTCIQREVTDISIENNIGKPLGNVTCYVLNENLLPQPIGVIGELYVGGEGVSKGYLNRPELNTEKFISNPFKKGETLYKTGDLVKFNSDGSIVFVGREDNQVKFNGYRIELSNIEYYLNQHPKVKQSVVIHKKAEDNTNQIVAYIVVENYNDVDDLRQFLSEKVPYYMIPNQFFLCDKIPLTAIGKVDRKMLDEKMGREILVEEFVEPRSPNEKVLAQVFKEVLKHEKISLNANFYNLGGDSIKAIQIVSKLKELGYDIRVESILRSPALEDLAKVIDRNYREIDQSSVEGEVMFTPIQKYFFENSNISNHNHYNQSVVLKSTERINHESLKRSFLEIVNHHDALRMIFPIEETVRKQYCKPTNTENIDFFFYDISQDSDQLKLLDEYSNKVQESFNIEEGPLVKVLHFSLSDSDRIVILIHHLVIDGVSWRILFEDLAKLYNDFSLNTKSKLQLKTDSYKFWAEKFNEFVKNGSLDDEISYWQSLLDQKIIPIVQNDNLTKKAYTFTASKTITFDEETTSIIPTVHAKLNTRINDLLLASLGISIREVFNIDKTIILMEGHGREQIIPDIDVSRTIGWFTSIYPFIIDIEDTANPIESLIKTKENLRKIPNNGLGYGANKYLNSSLDSTLEPTLVFNYLGDFGSNVANQNNKVLFEFSSDEIGSSSSKKNTQDVPIDISGMIVDKQLTLSIRFDQNVCDSNKMEQLMFSFKNTLTDLVQSLLQLEDSKIITPNDLTYKGLSLEEVSIINKNNDVEDVYELSPLQLGMYYHWASDRNSNSYFEQMSYCINAPELNIDFVEKAYKKIIDRHSVLRTSFNNKYTVLPLQIVHKEVAINFKFKDISNNSSEEEIERIKAEDRLQGFNLETPSQIRLSVLKISDKKYEFIWSNHHILMDGWCISILVNEFYLILMSLNNNTSLQLKEPVKYSSYIDWLTKIDKKDSIKYWNNYLKDIKSITEVPFKTKNSLKKQSYNKERLVIDGPNFQEIKKLCLNQNITLNTFVQGVWGYLLSRYSKCQDAIFGTVVSGRPGSLVGVENIIGLFINTIPVRTHYQSDDTPISFLSRLHSESLECTNYHYESLSEIQSLTQAGRDLIDSILIFENYLIQDEVNDENTKLDSSNNFNLKVDDLSVFEQTNYDFNILVTPTSDSLRIEFNYNSSIFEKIAVKKIIEHFSSLSQKFFSDKDDLLIDINFITEAEKNEVLIDFNANQAEVPSNLTFLELFKEKAIQYPNKVAVFDSEKTLSYSELDQLSNKIAQFLDERFGFDKSPVGIFMDRSTFLIAFLMGILKSGRAYIPINPNEKKDRVNYIISQSQLKSVIVESKIIAEELDIVNVIDINDVLHEIKDLKENQLAIVCPNDTAYIIFTSGTTGKPKGVEIKHLSLLNLLISIQQKPGISSEDFLYSVTNFTFDISILEFFAPLISGASLYIASKEILSDPIALIEDIDSKNPTIIQATPSFYQILYNANWKGNKKLRALVGGDLSNRQLIEKLLKTTNEVWNMYGPTETTIWSTIHKIESPEEYYNIGKPINNTHVYILDQNRNLVPKGIAGSIYIGGIGLSKGYYSSQEITSEKFISNPFIKNEIIYDTGDLGSWNMDGSILFLGRKERQNKIRGFRVDVSEIEDYLINYVDYINEAVVEIKEVNDEKYIVAYLVCTKKCDIADIIKKVRPHMPSFMIPNNIVQLDSMPLNSNGKVDRSLLPNIENYFSEENQIVAPKNEKEQILIDVFSEVLKVKSISTKDSFYSLRGDSIKSIQVTSKLRQNGYRIDLKDLFSTFSIEELALKMEMSNLLNHEAFTVKNKWDFGDYFPLSPNQMRYFYSEYNRVVRNFTVKNYERKQFELNFRNFINHFSFLNVVFELNGEQIVQAYYPTEKIEFDFLEILRKDYSVKLLDQLIFEYFKKPYELIGGKLIKILVVKDSDSNAKVYVGIHHALADNYTANILQNELRKYFDGESTYHFPEYISNFNFINWQQQFLESVEGKKQRSYWFEVLSKANLSEQLAKNSNEYIDFVLQDATISGADFDMLQAISNKNNIPISGIVLLFYHLILNEINLKDKKLLGVMIDGRLDNHPDLNQEKLLGVIDNILPIPIEQFDENQIDDFIINVYHNFLQHKENQQIPFEVIRKDIKNAINKDIQANIAGYLNLLSYDSSISQEDISNQISIYNDSFDWFNGINLTCFLHNNAIELTLTIPKEMYKKSKEAYSLRFHLKQLFNYKFKL